jgi:hypothetical protein
MGWFEILSLIIKYGPKLFSMVSEIIDLIKGVDDVQKKEALHVELKSAAVVAKSNGDRRPLRDLRDRLYEMRDGSRPGPRAA